jgi:hypothetical protein
MIALSQRVWSAACEVRTSAGAPLRFRLPQPFDQGNWRLALPQYAMFGAGTSRARAASGDRPPLPSRRIQPGWPPRAPLRGFCCVVAWVRARAERSTRADANRHVQFGEVGMRCGGLQPACPVGVCGPNFVSGKAGSAPDAHRSHGTLAWSRGAGGLGNPRSVAETSGARRLRNGVCRDHCRLTYVEAVERAGRSEAAGTAIAVQV